MYVYCTREAAKPNSRLRQFAVIMTLIMNKAFIFDLDGVLINDEAIWEKRKQELYISVFGADITAKLGSTLGVNMDGIYEKARAVGTTAKKATFVEGFFAIADAIYKTAPIPEGLDELVDTLKELGYRIGIVSASPLTWITTVTKRLPFEKDIELIISLHERPDLAHKPAPDGYTEAMKILEASPETTIVLEDSNSGIQSAKLSGAFTIGLRQNLVPGYQQEGADAYADSMRDIAAIVVRQHAANQP